MFLGKSAPRHLQPWWWVSWLAPAGLLVLTALCAGDLIVPSAAGIGFAVGMPLAAAIHLVASRVKLRSLRGNLLATALGALLVGVTAWISLDGVAPGTPLAVGTVAAVGDSIVLPVGTDGEVRLLTTAAASDTPEAGFALTLSGSVKPLVIRFDRAVTHRGKGRSREHSATSAFAAKYFVTDVAPGTRRLHVTEVHGASRASLLVRIYGPALPLWLALAAGLVVFGTVVILTFRLRLSDHTVAIAAAGIGFGLAFSSLATPEAVLRAAYAAVFYGALPGGAIGAIVGRIARRSTPRTGPSARRRGRGRATGNTGTR